MFRPFLILSTTFNSTNATHCSLDCPPWCQSRLSPLVYNRLSGPVPRVRWIYTSCSTACTWRTVVRAAFHRRTYGKSPTLYAVNLVPRDRDSTLAHTTLVVRAFKSPSGIVTLVVRTLHRRTCRSSVLGYFQTAAFAVSHPLVPRTVCSRGTVRHTTLLPSV